MGKPSPLTNEISRWTIVPRILSSLCCAALACAFGCVQPFIWHWMWSALHPGHFGREYVYLLPFILAIVGGIGGGIIGLFAGAAAPSRVGFAVSFWGLGLLHIATGLVFLSYPATTVVAMLSILIPAVVVEFVLGSVFWFTHSVARQTAR